MSASLCPSAAAKKEVADLFIAASAISPGGDHARLLAHLYRTALDSISALDAEYDRLLKSGGQS